MNSFLDFRRGEVILKIVVAPRASRTGVIGLFDGRLKVALAAPPVDGAANAALIEFLSETLGVPKRSVQITNGHASKRKTVAIAGIDEHRAMSALKIPVKLVR